MKKKFLVGLPTKLLVVVGMVLGLNGSVFATPIEIDFTARISDVNDQYSLLGGSVASGSIISGTWQLDTNGFPDANSHFNIQAGGRSYEAKIDGGGYGYLQIVNDDPQHGDYIHPAIFNAAPTADTYTRMIYIWAQNWTTADAIDSTAIPQELVPNDWDTIYVVVAGFNPYDSFQNYDFRANILTAEVAPIPEPSTMLLMGIGLVSLAGIIPRRKEQ